MATSTESLDYRALLVGLLELDEAAADEDIQAAYDEKMAEMAEAEAPVPDEEIVEEEVVEPAPPPPKRKAAAPRSKAMGILGY